MKLKKIVSLALAGVMAVSMLAGCSTNEPEQKPGDDEQTNVVANDISAEVAADIAKLPAYVTFAGSSKLSEALDYVGEFVGVKSVINGYLNNVQAKEFGGRYGDAGTLQGRLEKAVGATKDMTLENIGSVDTLIEAEKVDAYSIKPATAVRLYAVSGAMESKALNTLVAEAIDEYVTEYVYSLNKDMIDASDVWDKISGDDNDYMVNGIYNHSYAVSVSTSTKTVGESVVTLVAVQVVRTSVHH